MTQLQNKTALVFGEDTRSFLTVIRSLFKAGMVVDVVCFSNTSVALKSNCINKVYGLNHQSMTVDEWNTNVEEILLNNHYDIVIPCDERALFPLINIQEKLKINTQFAVPSQEKIGPLFNKVETRLTAEKCDISTAKGEKLNISTATFEALKTKFNLPLVLKPTQSYEEEQLNKRNSVRIAYDEASFLSFQTDNKNEECLVESYFTGYGVGVSILANQGNVSAAFAHARVSEPETGGGSSYRRAIPIEPSMLYACQKFCMHLKYTGVAMFEFKYNPQTEDWILIEINARFWGSLPLAVFAGVDFPNMYAHTLLNLYTPDKLTYNLSAYARSFTSDIYDIKSEFDSIKTKSGNTAALKQLIRRFMSFGRLLTGNDSIDSFTWYDQKPFWREFYELFNDKLYALPVIKQQLKKTRLQNFTDKISSMEIHNVFFVCYGNIMRSPFAEQVFSKKIQSTPLANLCVNSFGFHQIENRNAKPQCIEMAKKWHVDLSQHRSKWITQKALDQHTLVILFDLKNEHILNAYYSNVTYISLADLLPITSGFYREIEDPYDKSPQYLELCYQLIHDGVDALTQLLKEKNLER